MDHRGLQGRGRPKLRRCPAQTLRVTPAMAAGVVDRVWEVKDIVAVLEAWERQQEYKRVAART